ncbi:MAG: hypothetical protein LBN71_10490 [Tannerella sp.]|jgi:hypothetical protein|nr:hypothetical protein [Tannerella sp.]
MKKNLFFVACMFLGLWLTSCNQLGVAELEPEVECDDIFYHCNSEGTDLWPSLRTDTVIRSMITGKWQQIASNDGYNGLHYEESENTIEFTLSDEWIHTVPDGYSYTNTYRIDPLYLYGAQIVGDEPVINGNVFYYSFHFSDNKKELTIEFLMGNQLLIPGLATKCIYKRLN